MKVSTGLMLRIVVALMLLWAGGTKVFDPQQTINFVRWITHSVLGPEAGTVAVVGCVAALEAALALWLLLDRESRRPAIAASILLATYTLVLAWAATHPRSPSCPCLGTLGIGGPLAHAAGIVRNIGLIGCLLVGLIRPCGMSATSSVRTADRLARRAFTLIELLVSIAIVAVLIAILLPALRGARAQAAIAKRLSIVQQTGTALALYQDANAEVFPYLGTRGNPDAKLVLDHRPIEFTSPYFFQCALYINLISPEYAPIDPSVEVLVHEARHDLRDVLRSPIYLTQTAFAAPSYFGPFETPDDRPLYRPVRRAEMAFPSQKVLLLDLRSGSSAEVGFIRWVPNRVLVSMGDGSTRLREFVFDEENGNWSIRPYYGLLACGMTTHDGIAGRDF